MNPSSTKKTGGGMTRAKLTAALCCAAVCALAVEPSAALFENNDVKVSRALEKAHVKGSFHEHKMNRVMVYLQPGRQRFEYQDGRQPAVFDWKAGQVVWSRSEGMHSPEVVTDEGFNIIEVELKKPGAGNTAAAGGSSDALKLDGKHVSLEFENDQVRVLRVRLGAHESTPAIGESHNCVSVYLTDTTSHKFGDAVWEAPGARKIENTGDKPLEMILIELRT